jgi:glucose/arabinose dehydrogenase
MIPGLKRFVLGLAMILGNPLPGLTAPCPDPPERQSIPDITLNEVATGFLRPVHLTHAGDGSGRLFIVEQRGVIWILEQGRRVPEPFLDIQDRVESGGEKGLLGVAFSPNYLENGFFFVDYTTRRDGALYTRVARFHRLSAYRADPSSEQTVLKVLQPYSNHNGGQLVFGPDGYLYVGMGDGGASNDPHGNGQNPNTLLGALLRIDAEPRKTGRPYAIPPDNPFVGRAGFRPEVWAYGLRNPWRFSFDPLNGRLFLGDVGQDRREEIDLIVRGGNYGWNIMEGEICNPAVDAHCNPSGFELPIITYPNRGGSAVTGGFVYRGQAFPGLCGTYLYADYVTGRVWGLRYDGRHVTAHRELRPSESFLEKMKRRFKDAADLHISSFGLDEAGEIYAVDHISGRIFKVGPKSP